MKNSKLTFFAIIILFLSFIFFFSGISYSIFSYFGMGITNNVIYTGKIIFSYSDANGGENGIYIENASPVSDEVGKVLSGEGEYFDFTITASTTKTNLSYEIAVEKDPNSTLKEDWIKIYLTTLEGNQEFSTDITLNNNEVITFNQLTDTTNNLISGKTIYYGTVQAGEISYGKKFRLRMWIKDPNQTNFDYSILNQRFFSLKVNVGAVGTY